jgi:hypothetical protein
VLISAGVGATPVLAMLHALAGEHSTRPVWWVHGARNRDEHAFADEVDALLATLADGRRVLAYSQPAAGEPLGTQYDVTGRLDLPVLDRAQLPKDADYYVCGPDGFMRAIGAALTARGVAPEHVATEAFGAVAVHASGLVKSGDRPPHPPEGSPGSGPTVTFVRSSLAIPWDDRYPSLLDFAEACDVPVAGPDLPELVAPLALVVPAQLLVEALARTLGLDPDAPRGLSKVTQTDPVDDIPGGRA